MKIVPCDAHVSIELRPLGAFGEEEKMTPEEKLIEAVRNLPCLWQVNSKSYRDQRARENAWKEVTETVCGHSR